MRSNNSTYKWVPLNLPEFGFFSFLSNKVAEYEKCFPDTFPNLRNSKGLFLASDYSGDDKSAKFDAIAFLIMPFHSINEWHQKSQSIRKKYLHDKRTISYKKLGDRKRDNALLPYLSEANSIEGLIVVALVDKKIKSMFDSSSQTLIKDPQFAAYSDWDAKSFEKMMRTVHFVTCFLSGLAQKGQDIIWISDNDSMMPNDQRLGDFRGVFLQILDQFGWLRFPNVVIETGNSNTLLEDIIAIPDLAAGALVHLLDEWVELVNALALGISIPTPSTLKPKTKRLLKWLEDETQPLKRFFIVIDESRTTGGLNAMILRLHSEHLDNL